MFNEVVSLSGTDPETVAFSKLYRHVNVVQETGDNAGTITVAPKLPGASAFSALPTASGVMDLTDANEVFILGANHNQLFSGLRLTPADLTSAITVRVIAFDSIGL